MQGEAEHEGKLLMGVKLIVEIIPCQSLELSALQ